MPIYEIPVMVEADNERQAWFVAARLENLIEEGDLDIIAVEPPVLRLRIEEVMARLPETEWDRDDGA